MVNQTPNKKPKSAPQTKNANQTDKQLSPKTKEFLAKLQKIHDNVLRDIDNL